MLKKTLVRSKLVLLKHSEFQEQKKYMDSLSKNIVHSVVNLREAGSHFASMD